MLTRTITELESRRDKSRLSRCCKHAKNACYSATLHAAKWTLANKTVLEEFLEFRLEEAVPTDSSAGVAAIGLLSTTAMSVNVVSAPCSFAACWTLATTGAWPTVLAVTNPVGGAVVGFIGLAMIAISRYSTSSRVKEILYHQRRKLRSLIIDWTEISKADISRRQVIILISWCCIITNTLDMLMKCIDYLEQPARDRTASAYIRGIGRKDIIEGWAEFVEKDKRERKDRLSSQKKKGYRRKHQGRSRLNRSQRQVRRYMKELAHTERTSLLKSLERLRDTGELYESGSSDSESEAESTE